MLPTSNGVPYLPDGHVLDQHSQPIPLWIRFFIFICVYVVGISLYSLAEGTAAERVFTETLGSKAASLLINLVSPEISTHALGSRIIAPGGGINIQNGCEGTDLLILLLAGFAAAPMAIRRRLTGLLIGLGLAIFLNQVRILCLFYSFRASKELFDLLHTTVAPIVLIILLASYFYVWTNHGRSGVTY